MTEPQGPGMGPADAEITRCDFSPRKHATGMFTFWLVFFAPKKRAAVRPKLTFPPVEKAPRFLRHVVSFMIASRPRPAPAANTFVTATPTPSAIVKCAKFLQNLVILPYLIKRRLPHIPQFHIEIGAGLHLPPGADDTVGKPCQTATAEPALDA